MRLNRKIRIGAAIVAATLLLLGLITIYRNSRSQTTTGTTFTADTGTDNGVPVTPVASTRVAVARQDIPQRAIITADMFEMKDAAPGEDARVFITNPATQAVGFITARPITARSRIRRGDFVGHISEVGIAGALLPGRRAMIVQVPGKSTLHDLVRIGDRVDVVASFDQQEARTIVQDVRVLAVDVFGKDYPQVKVAMRGTYKAPERSIETAVPPSTPNTNPPVNADAPAGQNPQAAPQGAPEPTPTQGPPPPAPESSFTLEVTPEQATAIALTQSAGQNIDFLLRPSTEPSVVTGTGAVGANGATLASGQNGETTIQAVSTTRDRLAPYASRLKRGGTQSNASNKNSVPTREISAPTRARRRPDYGSDFSGPTIPVPEAPTSLSPAAPQSFPQTAPPPPATYEIPVYGDGKLVRTDTVKKPRE